MAIPSRQEVADSVKLQQPKKPPVPRASRQKVLDDIFSGGPNKNLPFATPTTYELPQANLVIGQSSIKKSGGGGFFGLLGDVIDIIDTPRAIVVSTIKETGDLFRGQGFNFGEWYNQVEDNIMMGEVLRDWGVDLPGPLDFALGLGLDIALDPLTYAFGLGVAARASNPARYAAKLSSAADKATDPAVKKLLSEAAGRVAANKSIAAAGPEALEMVGLKAGLGFTLPGTGLLGRTIIEKPLRKLAPKVGESLDARRVAQLPGAKIPKNSPNPWLYGDEVLDLADEAVRRDVVNTMQLIRQGKSLEGIADPIVAAARQAGRMPVEVVQFGKTGRGIQVINSAAGKLLGAAVATKYGALVAKNLSPEYDVNKAFRDLGRRAVKGDADAAQELRSLGKLTELRDSWAIKSGRWGQETLTELTSLSDKAKKLGVDLDELMMRVSAEEKFIGGGIAPQANPLISDIDPRYYTDTDMSSLYDDARNFWDGLGTRAKGVLEDFQVIRDELYVTRYLADDVSSDLFDITNDSFQVLRGTATKGRKYVTPTAFVREITGGSQGRARQLAREKGITLEEGFFNRADEAWIQDLGNRLDQAELLLTGTAVDGRKITNAWLGSPLKNQKGVSVQQQMKDIGEVVYGNDFVDVFSGDFSGVITRYISQVQGQLRVQGIVSDLRKAGIFLSGDASKTPNASALFAKSVDDAIEDLDLIAKDLDVRYGTKEVNGKDLIDIELKIGYHANRMLQLEEQLTAAGLIARGESIDNILTSPQLTGVARQQLIAYQKASLEVARLQALSQNIKRVVAQLQMGNYEAVRDLSPEAFALLSPAKAQSKRATPNLKNAINDRDAVLNTMDEAVEFLNTVASKLNDMYELGNSIRRTMAAVEDPALARFYDDLLNELDVALAGNFEDLRLMNKTYLNNVMDDPTVRTADLLNDAAREYEKMMQGLMGPEISKFLNDLKPGSLKGKAITFTPAEKELMAIAKASGSPEFVKYVERISEYRRLAQQLHPDNLYQSLVNASDDLARGAASGEGAVLRMSDLLEIDEIAFKIDALEVALSTGDSAKRAIALRKLLELQRQRQAALNVARDELDATTDFIRRTYDEINRNTEITRGLEASRDEINFNNVNRDAILDAQRQKHINDLQMDMDSGILPRQLGAMGFEEALEQNTKRLDAFNDIARGLVNDARALNDLADVAGDTLNDWLVGFTGKPMGGLSQRTQSVLGDNFLITNVTDDEYVQLFAEAFQSAARLQDPANFSKFTRSYLKFQNWWKATAVSTPGFFMRNGFGGMWINNQIAGVPMYMHARVKLIQREAAKRASKEDIVRGLDELIEDGGFNLGVKGRAVGGPTRVSKEELEIFREWYSAGMAQSGQVSMEVKNMMDLPTAQRGRFAGSNNPFKAEFRLYSAIRSVNQDTEFILRGAVAHHMMTTGSPIEDAYRSVMKYHFDYSDLTRADQYIKLASPFWVWQKNIIPVLVSSIGKNPKAWSRLNQVKGELELQSPADGIMPNWFHENMGIRMPFKIGGSRAYVMPDLPFRDLNRYLKEMENPGDVKGLAKGTLRAFGESAMPPFKVPIEMWAGKQVFADIPLTGRYQQLPAIYDFPMAREALGLLGLAEKAPNGRWVARDSSLYAMDSFFPLLGRARRLFPNEESKQEALITTWFNTIGGAGLRANTPRLRRNEIYRRNREYADMIQERNDKLRRER